MKDTMENLNQGTYIVIFYERESGEGTNGKPYRAVVGELIGSRTQKRLRLAAYTYDENKFTLFEDKGQIPLNITLAVTGTLQFGMDEAGEKLISLFIKPTRIQEAPYPAMPSPSFAQTMEDKKKEPEAAPPPEGDVILEPL